MLVEAAFTGSKAPGLLRAFYQRVRARRGTQIATVATDRKLVCLCWTMLERVEDYAFARQSLTNKKLRALKPRAELPALADHRRQQASLARQRDALAASAIHERFLPSTQPLRLERGHVRRPSSRRRRPASLPTITQHDPPIAGPPNTNPQITPNTQTSGQTSN
jgi:hypothetical protein